MTESEPGTPPLSGIRVLDLSNLLAGPMTGMYLADFGADVIKVEHPEHGDELRRWGNSRNGVGLYWKVLNRNKRLVTLNLSVEAGRVLALRLAEHCDVVIEAFRPGTLDRWGLGYDTLRERNPGIIVAHVSGYGQSGPLSHRPGFGTIAEAFSGYAAVNGYADRPPLLPAFGLADSTTAVFTAFAIMLALRHRDHTGEGQEIDAALYEGLFTLIGPHVVDFDQLGVVQGRQGNRLPFVSPRTTFQTADGHWIAVAGSTQATFERIARGLEISDVIDDPRFADNGLRIRNADALEARLAEAIAARGLDEVLEIFDESAAPGGAALDVSEIFAHPHYAARENVTTVADDELGTIRMQNVVPRLTRSPGAIRHAGLTAGAHNHEIYGGLLGLSESELRELARAGVA